jgi:hypothetical protein
LTALRVRILLVQFGKKFPSKELDGHRRVLAGRKSTGGPTFGGASRLDGAGGYARGFRAAKRL